MVSPATTKAIGTRWGRPAASAVARRATRAAAKRARASSRVTPAGSGLAGEFGDRLFDLLQLWLDHAVAGTRKPPGDEAGARLGELLDLLRIGRRAHRHEVDRPLGAPAQLGGAVEDVRRPVREPGVAEGEHAVDHGRAEAADKDRRVRSLGGLRLAEDPVEVDELTVEGRFVLGPDRLDRFDPL